MGQLPKEEVKHFIETEAEYQAALVRMKEVEKLLRRYAPACLADEHLLLSQNIRAFAAKSTKAAIVRLLRRAEADVGLLYSHGNDQEIESVQFTLEALAKDLGIDITPEDYK